MPDYERHALRGWAGGDPRYGAAVGRPSVRADNPSYDGRLCLRRVRLNSGGYDHLGTYFGVGEPLYWCANDEGSIDFMLRAAHRKIARDKVLARYPHAMVRR